MECRRYGYFILGHFVVGHIMRCADKMLTDKIPVDKTLVKIAREDKILAILLDGRTKCQSCQNTKFFVRMVK